MAYKPTYVKLTSDDIQIIRSKANFSVPEVVVEKVCAYLGCREDLTTVSRKHEIRLVEKRWKRIWNDPDIWKIQIVDQIGVKEKLWH